MTLKRRYLLLVLLGVQLVAIVPAHAQIDIGQFDEDLPNFFTWFSRMFSALSPYALIGVAVLAGALLLLVVASLIGRFLGRKGGSSSGDDEIQFVDPLNYTEQDYKRYIERDLEEGKKPISWQLFDKYQERLQILRQVEQASPNKKRGYVYGDDKQKRLKLTPWERDYLLDAAKDAGIKPQTKEYRKYRKDLLEGYDFYVASKGAQWKDPPAPKGRKGKKMRQDDRVFGPMINGGRRRGRDSFDLISAAAGGRGRRGRADDFNLFAPTGGRGRRGRDSDFDLFGPPRGAGRRGGSDSFMDMMLGAPTRRRRRR